MKKFKFCILILGAILVGCANGEISEWAHDTQGAGFDGVVACRTISEAMSIAEAAQCFLGDGVSRTLSPVEDVKVIRGSYSRSERSDTLMYVVNYTDNEGYAVISANRATEAILAVTENGHFESMDDVDNPGMKIFLTAAHEYAVSVLDTDASTVLSGEYDKLVRYMEIVSVISDVVEGPRVVVKWGQEENTGAYCPNGICGCAPLAAAMAMSYIEEPASISLTFDGAPVSSVELNWSSIKAGTSNDALGLLCRQIGKLAYSEYDGSNGTSTYPNYLRQALISTISSGHVSGYTYRAPYAYRDLNDGVLIASGYLYLDDNEIAGHAWIVDGYRVRKLITETYIQEEMSNGQIGLPVLQDSTTSTVYYNHINWGWNGKNNGYFLAGVFDCANAFAWDDKSQDNDVTYNFTFDFMYMLIN